MHHATTVALTVVVGALLLAACGPDENDDANPAAASPQRAATPAAPVSTPTSTPDPDPDATPAISAQQFCAEADATITRWDLPEHLTDTLQRGVIELRYRLPPGAEPLLIWMGVDIDRGGATVGDIVAAYPDAEAFFPNADPATLVPATIPVHGFDMEVDGRVHTIEVLISLPSEAAFDGSATWSWSRVLDPPFEVSPPRLVFEFRADGTRLLMDGQHCTPRIVPLP